MLRAAVDECAMCAVQVGEQVCGSDGVTYESECELQRTVCQQKRHVTVTHRGACSAYLYCLCSKLYK
jgi:hypothetical protein